MKDLLVTHIKDIDGLSPVILMNLWGKSFEYKLLDTFEVGTYLTELLTKDLQDYEHIYIVDLTVPEEIYPMIEKSKDRHKFLIFDHHETHNYARSYPYVTLDMEECGTTLFYQYLQTQGLSTNPCLDQYIEAVKDLDLWTFKKNHNTLSPQLGSLLELLGETRYIDEITALLRAETQAFTLNSFLNRLLELEEENKKRYIDKREERMIRGTLFKDINIGMVYAEKYRSEIGDELLKRHPDLDVIVIVNMNGGISLRSRDVDVSKIASYFGGGGHIHASGIGIPLEIRKEVFKTLLKGEIHIED